MSRRNQATDMSARYCTWSRETRDGSIALTGSLEDLRTGCVLILRDGVVVRLNVGTPIEHEGKWYAHVLVNIKREAGGSWWPPNWRLDTDLPKEEPAANSKPSPKLVEDRKQA